MAVKDGPAAEQERACMRELEIAGKLPGRRKLTATWQLSGDFGGELGLSQGEPDCGDLLTSAYFDLFLGIS
jgi:hypothetical protein